LGGASNGQERRTKKRKIKQRVGQVGTGRLRAQGLTMAGQLTGEHETPRGGNQRDPLGM